MENEGNHDVTAATVLVERQAQCLLIRINRPDKANSLDLAMTATIAGAVHGAAADESLRSIVLAAAGDRVFSAGVDIRERPADGDMEAQRVRRTAGFNAMIDAIMACPKPVVAAVNGLATGAGAMVALVCDARIAARSAAVSMPEIELGTATLVGGAIALHFGGIALATDLVQTGRRMPAEEALRRNLVDAVVAPEELDARAMAHAAMLGAKHQEAFAANKRWLLRGLRAAIAEAREAH